MKSSKEYAAFLLSRRDYPQGELKEKLLGKGYDPEEVESLLRDFRERGWLDDRRFGAAWIRSRIPEGKSRNALLAGLLRKGLDPGLAREILQEAWSGQEEETALRRQIEKYRRSGRPPERSKMISRLMGRGFPQGLIVKLLNEEAD